MKRAALILLLALAAPAPAQSVMDRLAAVEQGTAALNARLAAVESKLDALAAKIDALGKTAPAPAPTFWENGLEWRWDGGTSRFVPTQPGWYWDAPSGMWCRDLPRAPARAPVFLPPMMPRFGTPFACAPGGT